MKRLLLWFCLGLLMVVIAVASSKVRAGNSILTPLIPDPALASLVKQLDAEQAIAEQARLDRSAQLTKKIFRKHPEAAFPLDCFAEGKKGFMDFSGHLVIPLCFDDVSPFSDGVAQVGMEGEGGRYLFGFINREGIFVIPPTLDFKKYDQPSDYDTLHGFSENRLPLRREPGGKLGYIDKMGSFVIEPQFDRARPFSEGRAGVCWKQGNPASDNYRCGYIDLQGNLVIKPQFDNVGLFQGGVAGVSMLDAPLGEVRLGLIDRTGKFLVEPNLDCLGYLCGNFESTKFYSGLLLARIPVKKEPVQNLDDGIPDDPFGPGKWGYVRKTGGYAIPPRYSNASNFYAGRAVVALAEEPESSPGSYSGRVVLIDPTGKIISTPNQNPEPLFDTYYSGESLIDGMMPASGNVGVGVTNQLKGITDRDGRWIIPPQFEYVGAGKFSEGLLKVKDAKSHLWGYIDRRGNWVIKPQYQNAESFSNGFAAVQDNKGKWGYINSRGEVVITPKFDSAQSFQSVGLAVVKLNEKFGLVNRSGGYLLEPKYYSISSFDGEFAEVRLNEKSYTFFIDKSGRFLPYGLTYFTTDVSHFSKEGLIPVWQPPNASQP